MLCDVSSCGGGRRDRRATSDRGGRGRWQSRPRCRREQLLHIIIGGLRGQVRPVQTSVTLAGESAGDP